MEEQSLVSSNPAKVNIHKGSEATTPHYFREFLNTHASALAKALQDNDQGSLESLMQQLATTLPKTYAFREIAAIISRQPDNSLMVTTVEGDIDKIDGKRASDLLDEVIGTFPANAEQLLFVHTHPATQSIIGPLTPNQVGFSDADEGFLRILGGKLRTRFDLTNVTSSLVTANSQQIVLYEGKNNGPAWGWVLNPNENSQQFAHL